jgi:hypothetical protein
MMLMERYKIAKQNGYYINENGEAFSAKQKLKLIVKSGKYPYYFFNAKINGRHCRIMVHRLQAFQKYGDAMFEPGIVVRHLNGISTDNSYSNIGIGTYQDNSLDIPQETRIHLAKHASSFAQKYNHEEVYDYYLETKSYKKVMERFNITSKGVIAYVIKKMKKSL